MIWFYRSIYKEGKFGKRLRYNFITITGLIRLQEVLKHSDPEVKWLVRRLVPGEDNRPLLKSLRVTGETRVILDCPADRVLEYLRQANEVKFFEDYMVNNSYK